MNEEQALPSLIRKAAKSLSKEQMSRKMLPVPFPRRKSVWVIGRLLFKTKLEERLHHTIFKYMKIASDRFGLHHCVVTFEFSELQNNAAGQVRQMKNGNYHITLDVSMIWDTQRIAAAIGHEMAHIFLFQQNIEIGNQDHLELLTDTIAALAGFARIMYSARTREIRMKVFAFFTTKSKSKIGYLGKHSFKRLLKYNKWICSDKPFRYLGGKSIKSSSLTCPACHQNLKIPPKVGRFIVNCPSCHIKQDIRIVADRSKLDKLGFFFDLFRII